MTRHLLIAVTAFTVLSGSTALVSAEPPRPNSPPNILWITADDLSPTLGCYGDAYATTPHLDRLAAQSTRYTHAFATAPVCSPARFCLITGCYPQSLGTHNMRSTFPIPPEIDGFPAELRRRGYYTTNNEKTDYNTANEGAIIRASWDESSGTAHWRNQPADGRAGRPFFSVFNLMTSHQSRTMVWPREQFVEQVQSRLSPEQIHDPETAPVPPYYPDTPVVRRTIARYYDCVTAMDQDVGEILQQLEDDGLADDTIVFFFSDHGSGMPRHKRLLLDSGMHVPLLIRFPEKYRHLAPAAPGTSVDRLVSFVDFAPTVLSLAGVPRPAYMQGTAFLGADAGPPREYVYGHRDRVDEVFDLARSVRDARYLYVRNYTPQLGWNQPSAWPDAAEISGEFANITRERATEAQWQFVSPTRPVEELYDCASDPQNLHNLADSADHAAVLERLRKQHRWQIRAIDDQGFIPEAHLADLLAAGESPRPLREPAGSLEPVYNAAWNVGLADEETHMHHLRSRRVGVRYWGAVGLAAAEAISPETIARLRILLRDRIPIVRIAAAETLARHGQAGTALPVLKRALAHEDLNVVLYATRTVELLGEQAAAAVPEMLEVAGRADRIRADVPPGTVVPGEPDLAWFCSFSARAFLARIAVDGESP